MYRSYSFTCKLQHTCLYLVSVHQMAPPLIVVVVVYVTQWQVIVITFTGSIKKYQQLLCAYWCETMYFSGITSHVTPATVTDDSTCSRLRPRFVPCTVSGVPPSCGPVKGMTFNHSSSIQWLLSPQAIIIIIIGFVSTYINDQHTLQLFKIRGSVKNFSE